MIKYGMLLFASIIFFSSVYSQDSVSYKADTSYQTILYWQNWYKDLYQNGVDMQNDSFRVSPEFLKIARDSVYKSIIYPTSYTWEGVRDLLTNMDLKKAFWYMIKLYRADTANRRIVVGCLSAYKNNLDIEKAITSSFYTYAFLDPAVAIIKNNRAVFTRPDILESELNDVKQIIMYVRGQKGLQQPMVDNQTRK